MLTEAGLVAATSKDKNYSSNPVTAVFGLVWSPYPTLDLDAGVKFGLTSAADSSGLTAGIALRL